MTEQNALAIIQGDIFATQEAFMARRADVSMNFEAEAGFAVQLLTAKEYTMKVALGARQSVVDAIVNVSAIGLSLNPALKHAYLVPRDRKIILDISYMGLLHLAVMSGSIKWGQANVVYEADNFVIRGFDESPIHERKPFAKDRGGPIGAYCVVKTNEGDYLTTPMALTELYNVRDRSEAWKRGEPGKRGPWESFEEEMMKKTVIKRAYKLWPKTNQSTRLETAIQHLNEQGEGIIFDPKPTGHVVEERPEVNPELLAAARAAADQGRTYFAGWFKDTARGGQTTQEMRNELRHEMDDLAKRCAVADRPPIEDAVIVGESPPNDSPPNDPPAPDEPSGGPPDDWVSAYEDAERGQ